LSLGYALKHNQIFDNIFENIKEMTHSIYDDFKKKDQTAGIQAFQKYRISGIRGEVTHGLISVKSALQLLTDESDLTLRQVLKHLILISEDTVFLKRSKSLETYHHIKQLIQDTDINDLDELMKMNQLMIDKNISFGGSADLLIVTIFLKSIKMKFFS
jgi:triphosphoribosyl-dephospho-CoA synthetase